MKKLIRAFASVSMICVLAIAMLLILFPNQWKQNIYPSIAQALPTSMHSMLPQMTLNRTTCDALEANLQSFADYLKTNQEIVDIKGMNSLDEQLLRIQERINSIPSDLRNMVCEQESSRLEGLKSVFSLGAMYSNES